MLTRFIEATQGIEGGFNHGKFMVARFTPEEWERRCEMDAHLGRNFGLLQRTGWTESHVLVIDLATGEGGMFRPGGSASADLHKRKVWVCPMFEPFLEWLYSLGEFSLYELPPIVELPGAPASMAGYRREGLRGDS